MPPELEAVPRPTDMGYSAMQYLEAHGLVARQPSVRSSHYETALSDPFRYYLTCRLGLSPALRYSPALVRGSWFHQRFLYHTLLVDEQAERLSRDLEVRFQELNQICDAHGIGADRRATILERENQDFLMASAWFHVVETVPLPGQPYTLLEWMRQPHLRDLGGEIFILWHHQLDEATRVRCAARLDRLIHNEQTNTVWIVDPKTCAEPTTTRLATCPIEFQTQHYMDGIQNLIDCGKLQRTFSLPDDVTLGGFIHVAVRKPQIKMGREDRACREYEHTLRSGPRRGEVEIRREYTGDPEYRLYVERCREWLTATGRYTHLAEKWANEPIVNRSVIQGTMMEDTNWRAQYQKRLAYVHSLATMRPHPGNFLSSPSSIRAYGKLSDLAPFYTNPVGDWPGNVAELNLVPVWRDEDEDTGHRPRIVPTPL